MEIEVSLSWQNPHSGAWERVRLPLPIAIGKEPNIFPTTIGDQDVSRLVLKDSSVSRYHACMVWRNNQLVVIDQGSTNGILVNGVKVKETELSPDDRLVIGRYQLTVSFSPPQPVATAITVDTDCENTLSLSWADPATGETKTQVCLLPIVMGRELAKMPSQYQGLATTPVILEGLQVSRFHGLICQEGEEIIYIDQNSTRGSLVNGIKVSRTALKTSDVLQIGCYEIVIGRIANRQESVPTQMHSPTPTVLVFPEEAISEPTPAPGAVPASPPEIADFPPPCFQSLLVRVQDLHATGLPVSETIYATIGGGLGSYIWADYLRIGGVPAQEIVAIGLEPEPYARYKRLCLNSQIPLHERLRSNSDSCPDNIWGYPSYAWREAVRLLGQAKIGEALYHLWQVFAEPALAETYTPQAGNVFDSIDREAQRIGWSQIYRYGRVRSIRKTEDGRYAIAYSLGRGKHAFLLGRYVHLAVGYAAIQFLPDLQEYRERTGDFRTVVNAYEDHNYVYEQLEKEGGTVLLRGRGIVASRIVQRIYEARRHNSHINILHLMRSPKPYGNRYGRAQRRVENHYEFQPFNWPKACWGGDLLFLLESADPHTRQSLLSDWGGTTTASRSHWRRIVQEGLAQGWYNITFGEVETVEQGADGRTITFIKGKGIKGKIQLEADFIIDATGLDAKILTNPLYADLVETYNLPINFLGRLTVANDFSIVGMDNQRGRMFASGAATLGGPHAAVDSFLGLQFAALAIADSLTRSGAPHLHKINGLRSVIQWLKWVSNSPP